MLRTCLVCILMLIQFNLSGQKRASQVQYIDEGLAVISKKEFKKKLKSDLYYAYEYDLDTVLYKRLYVKYFLGKLDPLSRHQLFSLLTRRNNVDTTQNMVIHYQDTLKAKESFPRRDEIVWNKDGTHKHLISYNTFIKGHNRCNSRYSKKYKGKLYHFYNFNTGHPEQYKDLIWYKDHLKMLRRLFYNNSNNKNGWSVTLFPNGDYFIKNWSMDPKLAEELQNHTNWEQHLSNFKSRYYQLNPQLNPVENPSGS